MKRKLLRWVVFVGLFAVASSVAAKMEPFVEAPGMDWGGPESPVELPEGLSAFLAAGRLNPFGDIDAFTLTTTEPIVRGDVQVFVPVCGDHFTPFYPSITIIGPGLPPVEDDRFTVPAGMGMVVLQNDHSPTEERTIADHEMFGQRMYPPEIYPVQLTRPGQYTFIVWEPNAHSGAYMVGFLGSEHSMDASRSETERAQAMSLMGNGGYIDMDCQAPLAIEDCPPTPQPFSGAMPSAPQRSKVGQGYVLTGVVRASDTCLPIAGARLHFSMANPQGVYDDEHIGVVVTNRQGGYRIESDRPGGYGGEPHIHLLVSAQGYQTIDALHILTDGDDQGVMPMALRPD